MVFIVYFWVNKRHVTKFKELPIWYANLTDLERRALRQGLVAHPQSLKLIDQLESGESWNMLRIARSVYGDVVLDLPPAQVKRRLFNLSARIQKRILVEQNLGSSGKVACCEEEERLLYYKSLVLKDRNEELYRGLEALLKQCLAKNIFELLPDILYYLSYSYKVGRKDAAVFMQRDEDLLDVYAAFIRQRGLYTKARHLRRSGGLKYAEVDVYLKKIKAIADTYPAYPRLRMVYHFSCLSLGLGPGGNKATASQRHYQALEKRCLEYPDFPIMGYRLHYGVHIRYNLFKFKAYIDYRLLHFSSAYDYLKRAWDLQEHYSGVFKPGSIADYQELIIASRFSGRYNEALALTQAFIDNQQRKENEIGEAIAYAERVANYLYNYPRLKPDKEELAYLHSILEKLYRFYVDQGKLRSAGYYKNMQALFYFIHQEYTQAKKCYEDLHSLRYNEFYDLNAVAALFFDLPKQGDLMSVLSLLRQGFYKRNLKPETVTYYKMMEQLLKGLQEVQVF